MHSISFALPYHKHGNYPIISWEHTLSALNIDIFTITANKIMLYIYSTSAGFRTNEALLLVKLGAPYVDPEGGRPGRPTQAVRHTCSGNLGIVKILHYFRLDKFKITPHKKKSIV